MTAGQILVVEDTVTWQETYDEWFSDRDHTVVIVASLQDARSAIDTTAFDAAIVDINLSKGPNNADGLEVVKYFGAHSPRTQVVVVSGSITPDVAQRLTESGVDFVPRNELSYKPFVQLIEAKIEQAKQG